jgi:hypothetical protein
MTFAPIDIRTDEPRDDRLHRMAEMRAVKTRENRLRRMAEHQGFLLRKSRGRDPQALDYDRWWLIEPQSGGSVLAGQWVADLDDVEQYFIENPAAESSA